MGKSVYIALRSPSAGSCGFILPLVPFAKSFIILFSVFYTHVWWSWEIEFEGFVLFSFCFAVLREIF